MGNEATQTGRYQALAHSSWYGHTPYCQKLFEVELETNAKHQQNNTDFRKLVRQFLVCDKSWCVWPHDKPSQKVPDNGR